MAFVPVIRPYLGGSSGPYLGGSKRTSRDPHSRRAHASRDRRHSRETALARASSAQVLQPARPSSRPPSRPRKAADNARDRPRSEGRRVVEPSKTGRDGFRLQRAPAPHHQGEPRLSNVHEVLGRNVAARWVGARRVTRSRARNPPAPRVRVKKEQDTDLPASFADHGRSSAASPPTTPREPFTSVS